MQEEVEEKNGNFLWPCSVLNYRTTAEIKTWDQNLIDGLRMGRGGETAPCSATASNQDDFKRK